MTVFPGNDKDYDTSMDEILDMPFIELKEDNETGYPNGHLRMKHNAFCNHISAVMCWMPK